MIQKQFATFREMISPDLYIANLVDMERTGNYDRQVLLWMQEAYSQRAIAEKSDILAEMNMAWVTAGEPEDRIRQKRLRAIQAITCEIFDAEKQSGGGADIKAYIGAAQSLYAAECSRYGIQLHEVAECIRLAIENGQKPDFDRCARIAYIAMAKMSGMMTQIEGISGKDDANRVALALSNGIQDINSVMGGSKRLGRELLLAIEKISENPQIYLEFRDFADVFTAERGPWAYEPGQRTDCDLQP